MAAQSPPSLFEVKIGLPSLIETKVYAGNHLKRAKLQIKCPHILRSALTIGLPTCPLKSWLHPWVKHVTSLPPGMDLDNLHLAGSVICVKFLNRNGNYLYYLHIIHLSTFYINPFMLRKMQLQLLKDCDII